jgi:anti-sigma regulatory factor (Ser/Thr protein kinase)
MADAARQLDLRFPAEPASVPRARRAVAEFAVAAHADPHQVDSVRLSVSEAVTNAVVHAYRGLPGSVHVTAAVVPDGLWILVADDGCGLEPRTDRPGLGLGLGLIAQAADELTIVSRSTGGTELRMRFGLLSRRRASQERGSVASARSPASSRFSTTT